MRHYFTFDGKSSKDFGMYLWGSDVLFSAPQKDVTEVTVQGRSGTLVYDNGRWLNTEHSYNAVIVDDAERNLRDFRSFVLSRKGYCRLEDTVNPDEFYMAYVKSSFNPVLTREFDMAKVRIEFTRKPQRYLKSGEQGIEYTASGTIYNPTYFDAKPLIRVIGTGTVAINDTIMTITGTQNYTDIDCEVGDCYCGDVGLNDKVSLSTYDFPVLHEGENTITLTGVTSVTVTPRWWRL